MSGSLLILVELVLVLIIVFGWGIYELRALRKFKRSAQTPPQKIAGER